MFATETEAFAEAERVYRAYNDEMLRLLSGVETADPFQYTTGAAYESDLRVLDQIRSSGSRVEGEIVVTSFEGQVALVDDALPTVEAIVCIDNSGTRVLDAEGNDVTPPTRLELAGFALSFVVEDSTLLISRSELLEGAACSA